MWGRKLLSLWKVFAGKIHAFQSRLLLVVLYFTVVAPFALYVKIAKDPLRIKDFNGSNWSHYHLRNSNLESARKQF